MKKFTPFVNVETIKNEDGNVKEFNVRTISFLPKDSEISLSGEGKSSDKVIYRKLEMKYSGTSEEYDYFKVNFTIGRDEIGLLERGVKVNVKPSENIAIATARGNDGNPIDYEDSGMI